MQIHTNYSFIELYKSQLLIRSIVNFWGTHKVHYTYIGEEALEVYGKYTMHEDPIFLKVKRK